MNSRESNRPSLFANGPTPPVGTGRILADMEGRQVEKPASRSLRALGSKPVLLALIGLLLVLALFAFLRPLRGGSDYASSPAPHAGDELTPPAGTGETVLPQSGAMIIDDPSLTANPEGQTDPLANDPLLAPPLETGSAATATASARNSTASRGSGRAATRAKAKAGPQDADLMDTLLGIIKQEKSGASATTHSSMDELLAEIRQREQREKVEADAAFDHVDSRNTTANSSVQSQLRKCPKATTAAGIECRSRICATWEGKDPACPAKTR